MKTILKQLLYKPFLLGICIIFPTLLLSQTNAIDEENHLKAILHVRKKTDSIRFYTNKLKQSKNQCRVLFAMIFEATSLYNDNEYKASSTLLDSVLYQIENNPKPNTFINSDLMAGKTYNETISVIKLNVYRRFFNIRKNEKRLTEAHQYLSLMQNSLNDLPKNNYYIKTKLSIAYSEASLKKVLGKREESLDILLKINNEIDSIPILKEDILYNNILKDKANINVQIGRNYTYLEKENPKLYGLAELYYDKAYKITQIIDSTDNKYKYANFFRKGELYYFRKDYKPALNLVNKASSYYNANDFNSGLYDLKAKIHSKLKNNDSAIYYSNQLVNNKKVGLKYNFAEVYEILAKNYYALNKIDSAYKYSQLSLKTYNELNLEKSETLNIINENQLSRITSLNVSINKKRKSLQYKLIGTISIALVFIVLAMVYIVHKKQSFNVKIEAFKKQFETLQNTNATKKEQSTSIDDETINRVLKGLADIEQSTLFLDKEFSLNVLAKLLNTNTSYLSRIINEHKKVSFKQYLIDIRIKALIKELEENPVVRKYSIEAMAESVGYKNASSFSRIFKNYVGITPSKYLSEKYSNRR